MRCEVENISLANLSKNLKSSISGPKYNFGKQGCPDLSIPPNDTSQLTYEIHLKSFERAKEGWQMDGDQKLEQSQIYKDRGTDFFKANKLDMAANKYRKVSLHGCYMVLFRKLFWTSCNNVPLSI